VHVSAYDPKLTIMTGAYFWWPVLSAVNMALSAQMSLCHAPRIQRYTKTGVFVCVRTLFVTLPSTTAESPPRPCDAMTMRSQPLSAAVAIMA